MHSVDAVADGFAFAHEDWCGAGGAAAGGEGRHAGGAAGVDGDGGVEAEDWWGVGVLVGVWWWARRRGWG